ncbi:OmpP1/FadL family transporter [Dysgonomonas sp. 520]|uniref:OmpP1/FadL family transporter n=1 Tax=Dysgonomonas sp. 520 TaxID=2302931 RepID=UPI0013D0694C|nr:outer membrane protein transport protein [Dysgonomonas sp. 520]NDW10660.1 hypothetical protein [Dysgonomonas sp. 520]
MSNISKSLLAVLLLCFSSISFAQNTNSPYSRYGYGVLTDQGAGISRSMGGLSYGLRKSANINPGNPASYSKIDSLTFIFDFGVSYSKTKLSDNSGSQTDDNGGLGYITMMMPLSKKIGISFGILPFSSVGYQFGNIETINGVDVKREFNGSGGLSQIYGGLAYEPFKGISIGANVSYLFGSLDNTRSVPAFGENYTNSLYIVTESKISTVKFDIGAQYEMPVMNNKLLTIGAVYTPAINSKSRFIKGVYTYNSSGSVTTARVDTTHNVNSGMPASYGLGFTLANRHNWLVGADVTFQEWSKIKYENLGNDNLDDIERFKDRWKVSAGFEYVANPMDRSYFKRIKFRGGANYSNSYLNVKTNEGSIGGYKQYGVTLGFGLPFRDMNFTGRTSYININFEYRHLAPEISNMVKEQYFGVSLGVNINDLWFVKNKFR